MGLIKLFFYTYRDEMLTVSEKRYGAKPALYFCGSYQKGE